MAEVIPFRGILYNLGMIDSLADVVVPPFDIISRQEQETAYQSHRFNMIRLELNKGAEGDSDEQNPHLQAAAYFNEWLTAGVLVRDTEPAFYLTSTDFQIERASVCRYGIIGRVGLEPFDRGIVLPHEKTFSRVRSERLDLMKACHANFSPIFAMYPDPGNELMNGFKTWANEQPPIADFIDGNGHRHRLWRLAGPLLTERISETLRERRLYIADGHHRYETALAYRQWLMDERGALSAGHPANYVMMYLMAMESSEMVILPAHRLLREVPGRLLDRLLERAPDFFEVSAFPFSDGTEGTAREALTEAMTGGPKRTRIGVFMKNRPVYYLLGLRPGVMDRIFGDKIQRALRDIDVTVLTRLVFMEMFGFDQARLDNDRLIGYASTLGGAIGKVADEDFDVAFLLNPTPIEQVRQVAEAGLIMPRKATYFYPKVLSGLVLNSLQPDRERFRTT